MAKGGKGDGKGRGKILNYDISRDGKGGGEQAREMGKVGGNFIILLLRGPGHIGKGNSHSKMYSISLILSEEFMSSRKNES